MVDLTNAKFLPNRFGGSEKKKTVYYNNRIYMVKFPDPVREKNNTLSYMNNAFSEDIGCKILQSIGFKTQNTFLAKYTEESGSEKIVVACEDFTQDGGTLSEFSKILLSDTDNTQSNKRRSCPIESIIEFMEKDKQLSQFPEIKEKFWDLFVADTLIGNTDRHLDNWGLLFVNNKIEFAPIYDCGSSLSPLLADDILEELYNNETEFRNIEYNITAPYTYKGQKIFCPPFYQTPPNDLSDAVKRVVPKINMQDIKKIIFNTEGLSDIRKHYLLKSVQYRNMNILQRCLKN